MKRIKTITPWLVLLSAVIRMVPIAAQVRGARRTAAVKGEEGKGAAVGPRGVAVKGEEGYAAARRHGAVAKGDEGYAAVGRRGAVAATEDGYARVGPRGAVVAGEEGYSAVGRHGVVVGNHYESYEAWRAVAGVSAAIAVGTMLARPPSAAVTVNAGGSSYYYSGGTYYTRVINGGAVAYQVVAPPAGAIIATLPAGCQSVRVGAVAYSQCGTTSTNECRPGTRLWFCIDSRATAAVSAAGHRRRHTDCPDANRGHDAVERRRLQDVLDARSRRLARPGRDCRGPNRSEALEIPPSLEENAARAATCPTDRLLQQLAEGIVARERRYGRDVSRVTLTAWRTEFDRVTLRANERTLRSYQYDAR